MRRLRLWWQRQCIICGDPIVGRLRTAKLCGKAACERVNRNAARRDHYARNRERMQAQQRERFQANRDYWRQAARLYDQRSRKPCLDCGVLVGRESKRCRGCSTRFRRSLLLEQYKKVSCRGCAKELLRPAAEHRKWVWCPDCDGMLAAAARRLGVSRERVRQLTKRVQLRGGGSTQREALNVVLADRGFSLEAMTAAPRPHGSPST